MVNAFQILIKKSHGRKLRRGREHKCGNNTATNCRGTECIVVNWFRAAQVLIKKVYIEQLNECLFFFHARSL